MSPPRRSLPRRLGRTLATTGFVAVVVLWAIFLRPQFLGGPAQLVLVSGTSMEPRMHGGDLVLVTRARTYRVGDRVAYRIPRGDPAAGRVVIHRIVGGSAAAGFVMRGDNRTTSDRWRPKRRDVVGAVRLRIPAVGRVALAILTPVGLGLLAGLAVFALIALGPDERKPRAPLRRRMRPRGRPRRRPDVARRQAIPQPAEPAAAAPRHASEPPPAAVVPRRASEGSPGAPAPAAAAPRRASEPPPGGVAPAPAPAAPRMTIRECLRCTSANLQAAGAAARARRLRYPDEPPTTGALLTELAASVQHAATRRRDRG